MTDQNKTTAAFALVMMFHRLDNKMLAQIQVDLAERKAAVQIPHPR